MTRTFLLAAHSLLALSALSFSCSTSSGQGSPGQDTKPARTSFPIVEYSVELLRGEDLERSKKYERAATVLSTDATKDVDSIAYLDYRTFSPLPVGKSDLIVLGKVLDVMAALSPSKTAVFTQITIQVETVLNQNSDAKPGGQVVVEREGGVVRYPSGAKIWHRVGEQEMPLSGRSYYFFLSNDFPRFGRQAKDLYLLTAYEVRKEHVYPLDTAAVFSVYRGKSESEFRNDLVNALTSR